MKTALNRLAAIGATALVALAIWDQIVRDPEFRTWHGQVFGIPYDFRKPTPSRLKQTVWAPEEERLISPHLFGVGWSVNLGRLYQLTLGRKIRG